MKGANRVARKIGDRNMFDAPEDNAKWFKPHKRMFKKLLLENSYALEVYDRKFVEECIENNETRFLAHVGSAEMMYRLLNNGYSVEKLVEDLK